jgi:hypothetical protein
VVDIESAVDAPQGVTNEVTVAVQCQPMNRAEWWGRQG